MVRLGSCERFLCYKPSGFLSLPRFPVLTLCFLCLTSPRSFTGCNTQDELLLMWDVKEPLRTLEIKYISSVSDQP